MKAFVRISLSLALTLALTLALAACGSSSNNNNKKSTPSGGAETIAFSIDVFGAAIGGSDIGVTLGDASIEDFNATPVAALTPTSTFSSGLLSGTLAINDSDATLGTLAGSVDVADVEALVAAAGLGTDLMICFELTSASDDSTDSGFDGTAQIVCTSPAFTATAGTETLTATLVP